jgi:hypothetical protein
MFLLCDVMQRAPHNNLLATPDYEEWKYYRKMTNFAFSPDNIRKVTARIPDDWLSHFGHVSHPVMQACSPCMLISAIDTVPYMHGHMTSLFTQDYKFTW